MKNHGLIPLLFGEIFDLQNSSQFSSKSTETKSKLNSLDKTFINLFRNFENGGKIIKNHGLTPLLFGDIFDLQISPQLSCKSTQIKPKLNALG